MESTRLTTGRPSYEFDDDDDASESIPLEARKFQSSSTPPESPRLSWRWLNSPLWCLSTVVLLLIVAGQVVYGSRRAARCGQHGTFDGGFSTEWEEVQPSIQTVQRRFTSPIRAHEDGTLYMIYDDSEPRYTTSGATFEEVDKAWDDLLRGRYVGLEDAEISWLNEDSFNPPLERIEYNYPGKITPGTYGGPDMLHSLHCLNALRKHLDMEHYGNHLGLPEQYIPMHIDHCIDQLRQAIICHGDMTPVTLRPVEMGNHSRALLGQTERMHTCRNGMDLRKWWWQRGERTGRVTIAD